MLNKQQQIFKMQIKDLILKTERVTWQDLQDLQPVNLKNNYHSEKVKQSIISNGFASSIYVWQDEDKIYIIDGHCRKDILIELESEGYNIPSKLNCTFLDLPNKKTAIKYLLQVFNQKTNPINEDNLKNWLEGLNTNLDDIDVEIQDLHIEIGENNIDYSLLDEEDNERLNDMSSDVKKAIQIEFNSDHYEEASELVKFWRSKEMYIGKFLLDKLKQEKGNL